MRGWRWGMVSVSYCLVAVIAIGLWTERSEIADRLLLPAPPTPVFDAAPQVHLPGDPIGKWPYKPCVEVKEVSARIELDTIHLADFGVPPSRRVEPECPALASHLRIKGTIVLDVTVGKDGTVEQIRYVSGHPMLVAGAMDAVKQWTWKPFLLNGRPVRAVSNLGMQIACDQR